MKIKCYTLFDITKTDINGRRLINGPDSIELNRKRNQQINFETILQLINMRSQPEDITDPIKTQIKLKTDDGWGCLYHKDKKPATVWSFEFSVNHVAVFDNGIEELGHLLNDCQDVPMIINLDETTKILNRLNVTPELRNIIFSVVRNE